MQAVSRDKKLCPAESVISRSRRERRRAYGLEDILVSKKPCPQICSADTRMTVPENRSMRNLILTAILTAVLVPVQAAQEPGD